MFIVILDIQDATTFSVRGPSYMDDGIKIPSKPSGNDRRTILVHPCSRCVFSLSACQILGVDLLSDNKKIDHICSLPGKIRYILWMNKREL